MNTTTRSNAHAAARFQSSRADAIAAAEAILKALRNADDANSAADDIDAGDMAHAATWLEAVAADVLPVIVDPTTRGPRADLPF